LESISASEVHVPGRPRDPAGVKALAIAARKSFEHYRPGGMHVHAGSVILEPSLTDTDFAEMAGQGVWLAKAGFGAYRRLVDPGLGRHLGRSRAQDATARVLYHVNGGPIAMPDADFPRLVNESDIAMQVCTAGNLRTTWSAAAARLAATADSRASRTIDSDLSLDT
jgi:enamidase